MSQPSAKSIAERIIEFNENDELRQLWGTVGRYEQIDQLSIELAKAYLELEKEHEELKRNVKTLKAAEICLKCYQVNYFSKESDDGK